MAFGRNVSLWVLGPLSFAMAVPAWAAPKGASTPASVRTRVTSPVAVTWVKDLDFAALRVTAAGTATVSADNGSLSVSGGVQRIAGTSQAAQFQVAAARAAILIINVPTGAITLTRVGGTQTMTVTNWDLDGTAGTFAIRIIPQNGILAFAVGARLNVNANQAEGTYVGQFNVSVDYF